jgi:hypothetical protein
LASEENIEFNKFDRSIGQKEKSGQTDRKRNEEKQIKEEKLFFVDAIFVTGVIQRITKQGNLYLFGQGNLSPVGIKFIIQIPNQLSCS